MSRAWLIAGAAFGVVLAGCAADKGAGGPTSDARDFERGRALYENNCRVCHTSKVHRRIPQLPVDRDELRAIVLTWVRFEGMQWTSEDVDDVVYYVDRVYYQFNK